MESVATISGGTRALPSRRKSAVIIVVLTLAMTVASFFATPQQEARAATAPSINDCLNYGSHPPTLYFGVRNQSQCVRAWQYFLKYTTWGAIKIDGKFGNETKWFTFGFQQRYAYLKADGIVGPRTWNVVRVLCAGDYRMVCDDRGSY